MNKLISKPTPETMQVNQIQIIMHESTNHVADSMNIQAGTPDLVIDLIFLMEVDEVHQRKKEDLEIMSKFLRKVSNLQRK